MTAKRQGQGGRQKKMAAKTKRQNDGSKDKKAKDKDDAQRLRRQTTSPKTMMPPKRQRQTGKKAIRCTKDDGKKATTGPMVAERQQRG
jgi:hypothetical protein